MWFPEHAERIRQLSPEAFGFGSALLGIGTCIGFYLIWRSLHRARIIEDMPTARLRSAPQGYVELEGAGRLLDGPPIVGPLTGTHCLWYRYKIEHQETNQDSRGRRSSHWNTLQSGTSDALFLLDDGTGRCIIDPDGAEVSVASRDVWYGHDEFPRRGPPRNKSWFRLGSGDYRYTEERLMPGPLYVLGWFCTLRNAPGDVNSEVALLLRDWKGDQPGLLTRFDRNGDGQVDATEWDAARAAALREVLRQRSQRPHAPSSNVVTRSPSDRHPFLLSAVPQRVLTRRYRRRSALALIAACLGVIATLWTLAARWS